MLRFVILWKFIITLLSKTRCFMNKGLITCLQLNSIGLNYSLIYNIFLNLMRVGMSAKDSNLLEPKMTVASAAEFLNITPQAVHKQIKSKNLKCPKIGNKYYLNYSIARELFNIKFTPQVIVGQIVKGGTGKTTTIDNLACCINSYGARVLKIDTDPQGNLTDLNCVDAEECPVLIDAIKDNVPIEECIVNVSEGMDIIPSRIENVVLDNVLIYEKIPLDRLYADLLSPIIHNYDYIFIDCPPTMGQSVTATSLFADKIIAPLNPDKFSSKGLKILLNEISLLNRKFKKDIDFKVFLNKFSSKTILSDKTIVSLISDPALEGHVISTTVQFSQEVPNTSDEDKSLFASLKNSSVKEDFNSLTLELLHISPEMARNNPSLAKGNMNEIEMA